MSKRLYVQIDSTFLIPQSTVHNLQSKPMTCWKLKLLAMCASILFVAVLAFAKPGVVTTSDGNTLEG
ncbi:MAG TPA: hypothetical protein PK402_13425, partial [Tepidisphaeraceae bacterium]|nr:hypothetical protein [Tepidisphaeraceae bacterium]